MSFASNAGLFPHQLDIINDRVLLVELTEQAYRDASFLDQRLLQQQPMQWANWSQLEAESAALADNAHYIFHIGHVGSTLISRLLGELDSVFALREPLLLRNFAELAALRGKPESPWSTDLFEPRLKIAMKWLARTFRDGQAALIKATSFANTITADIIDDGRPAIFLYVKPERYMQTILAGENSRQELAMLSGPRLVRLHETIGESPWNLWELSEGEHTALGWAGEMATLEAATGDNVLWVDFDAFLTDPASQLISIATHLGHEMPPQKAGELVAGPIMQRYSKAPEHGYTPQLRAQLLEQTQRERAADIAASKKWLDKAAAAFDPVAKALQRTAGAKNVQTD